ncbi:Hsp70 family protein [Pseudonocardia broussonetiae]|uniref:Hsp70 family protein n=1 Tax=Pseudonocardia broussonetiae TaxID=2736640 RepID=A0A6M6JFR7_9PSEU|nr:Hsp70 family protein [Pseudonocardia broussonetiae]QJY45953.1 Hsp70 family protein [Pseudonocardia broussonetiae]
MGYQLGIDLGTTYTSAAVCRSDDRRWVEPEVVTLGTRGATVPSVLFLAPDGSVVVGDAAERRALTDPDRVVREFKRRIGDDTPIVVAGRAFAPEELSARLVRWVVDRVAEREGGPATRIAVTHPASWGPHKRDLLAGALAAQGVSVTFLAEPQAAALHYAAAERIEPGSTIAVYDLGGGTFDAAVVRKADPARAGAGTAGFGLLGRPEGLDRLGGIDFDEAVFEHVRDGLPEVFSSLDPADPATLSAVARVRRDCTEAKEALSSDTEVSIPVLLPGARGSVRLHRSEFESLIRPYVEETVSALRSAVGSAGLTPDQLTAVLLVGGSSRIPLVAQLVSEQLGRPVAVDADPKNAIAKGAALSVSPKPTASWPGVSIPVVAGAGAASEMVTSRVAAPAPQPPRPSRGTPPPGMPQTPAPAQSYPAQSFAPQPYTPPRGGPTHEPATALLSGQGAPPPPPRPRAEPPTRYDGPEDERYDDEPRRRPIGVLIGVGGLVAVALLIIAVLAWPTGENGLSGNSVGTVGDTVSPTPEVTVEPTEAPAEPAPGTGNGSGNGSGSSNGGGSGGGSGSGSGSGGGGGGNGGGGTPPASSAPPVVVDPPPVEPTVVEPTVVEPTTGGGTTAPQGQGTTVPTNPGTGTPGTETEVASPPSSTGTTGTPVATGQTV